MAAIVNDRDLLLQATDPRFIEPEIIGAVRGVEISGSGSIFKWTGSNVSPSSITLSATLNLIPDGVVTWSVSQGSVSITPVGNACTVNGSTMTTDVATISASITVDGKAYSDTYSIARVTDGDQGEDGVRGTIHAHASRPNAVWNDSAANSAILSYTGSSARVQGDLVTLYNQSAGWSETREWTGSVWQFLEQVIDGNLIVTGTIAAEKITSGSCVGNEFTGGKFSGAIVEGSTEISVVDGGNFTLLGPGNNSQQYKLIYYGSQGKMDMDIRLENFGQSFFNTISSSGNVAVGGSLGSQGRINAYNGITTHASSIFNGGLSVNGGNLTVDQQLFVTGKATFSSNVDINGNVGGSHNLPVRDGSTWYYAWIIEGGSTRSIQIRFDQP